MTLDIYLVGVGGQGVLTIAELIVEAAFLANLPINYFPTEGMAQRGGFVKAQVRLGRTVIGPNIPECGADIVISLEISETLKAIRFLNPGGECLLWGHVWAPTAVMLGKAGYPSLQQVAGQVQQAGGRLVYLAEDALPEYHEDRSKSNIYVLGAAVVHTALGKMLDRKVFQHAIQNRWPSSSQRNLNSFRAGLESEICEVAV